MVLQEEIPTISSAVEWFGENVSPGFGWKKRQT